MSSKSSTNNAKNTKGKRLMINASEFAISKWSPIEIDFESEINKNKEMNSFLGFSRYNFGKDSSPVYNQLVVKTDPIKLTSYGIPSIGKYVKEDKNRKYIKVPYDESQPSCVALFKMFEEIDNYAINNKEKFITGPLAKFIKKYVYSPIIRTPLEVDEDDDEEENEENEETTKSKKPKKEKAKYAKLAIKTDFKSGDVQTVLFTREDGKPVKHDAKTITDMAKHVTWQSTIQMICSCNKISFSKNPATVGDNKGKRTYSIGFSILQCEVTEKSHMNQENVKADFSTYAFDDTVEVEEKEDKPVAKSKPSNDESDSDSEDDDSSDDEDDKPSSKTKQTQEDSDDDSSDDESVKDTKSLSKTKQPVKPNDDSSDDDSSDDDSSDDDSSDDDSSESEEEKPAPKKPVKGAKKK